MKISLASMIFLACTSCHIYPGRIAACEGIISLDHIDDPRLRQDAYQTIMQFIALDENIVLIRGDADRLRIKGEGASCKDFGKSFTDSPMRTFKGLTYKDV